MKVFALACKPDLIDKKAWMPSEAMIRFEEAILSSSISVFVRKLVCLRFSSAMSMREDCILIEVEYKPISLADYRERHDKSFEETFVETFFSFLENSLIVKAILVPLNLPKTLLMLYC